MEKEKKSLIKNFKALVEDILDNYEKYTDEEKAEIKKLFDDAASLNAILDKYDVEKKFDWKEYIDAVGLYFDAIRR